MRGLETVVAVAVSPAGALVLVVPVLGVCHVKAAKTPTPTSSRTNRILAAAIIKRRRFFGLRPPLPSFPSLSLVGGRGGWASSVGRLGSRNMSAAETDMPVRGGAVTGTVSSSGDAGSSGTGTGAASTSTPGASCSTTAVLRPHRYKAGIIAMRQRTIDVKNTAL